MFMNRSIPGSRNGYMIAENFVLQAAVSPAVIQMILFLRNMKPMMRFQKFLAIACPGTFENASESEALQKLSYTRKKVAKNLGIYDVYYVFRKVLKFNMMTSKE